MDVASHHALIDVIAPRVRFLGVAESFGAADGKVPGARAALAFAREYLRRQGRAGVFADLGPRPKIMQRLIIDALEYANARVFERSGSDDDHVACGVAIAGAMVVDGYAVIAHAGDARAYVWRRGTLQAITQDDAVVVAGVAAGAATRDRTHEPVRLLWRSLGTQARLEAALTVCDLSPEDRLCLCTSGVYRDVPPASLSAAIGGAGDRADVLGEVRRADGSVGGAAAIAFGSTAARARALPRARPIAIALVAAAAALGALLVRP